jgi:hypothetical protein
MKEGFNTPNNTSLLEITNEKNFGLYSKPELQFVASQLAALVVPVSPIVQSPSKRFYSIESSIHLDHNSDSSMEIEEQRANTIFLEVILGDYDHGSSDSKGVGINNSGGIFFDFDEANLIGEVNVQQKMKNEFFLEDDLTPKTMSIFRNKVEIFRNHISGDEGLIFLRALLKKAGESENLPSEPNILQKNLLSRCSVVLEILEEYELSKKSSSI